MTNETLAAYEAYVTLGEQIKSLTDQRKKAQAVIKKYHETENLSVITEAGFKSQIIPQVSTVNMIDEAKLIAKFGADAIADCYTTKTSTKMNFRCDRILVEG